MNIIRLLAAILSALLLTSCFPSKSSQTTTHPPPGRAATPRDKISPPPPSAQTLSPRVTSQTLSGIRFDGVTFDSRTHRLVVVDQAHGPGSKFADSAAAAKFLGGLAAINAGFFTPEGQPLGRIFSERKSVGVWNTASSLGSGLWFETTDGSSAIVRRRELDPDTPIRELIQAGPFLVENSREVDGLDSVKISARSLILWDGDSRWWIGHSSPCSLAALGQSLTTGAPAGWLIRQALNLDGGRSSDLWISKNITGGPVLIRPPWNRPVRNFLVLVAR